MLKIFRDAFKISFDNLILFTPTLVFMMFVLLYCSAIESYMQNYFVILIAGVVLFLTSGLFMAGWFYMIMCSIFNFKNNVVYEKSSDTFELLRKFTVGVGDFFAPCCLLSVVALGILSIVVLVSYVISINLLGVTGIYWHEFFEALASYPAFKEFLNEITINQLLIIYGWAVIFSVSMFLYALFTLFWVAELFYSTKNVFVALKKSVMLVFERPQVVWLFFIIIILNNILMMLNLFSLINPFAFLFMTLLYVYFIVFVFVLLFLYYEQEIQGDSNSFANGNRKK